MYLHNYAHISRGQLIFDLRGWFYCVCRFSNQVCIGQNDENAINLREKLFAI